MAGNLVGIQGLGAAQHMAGAATGVLDGLGGPMGLVGRMAGLGTDELEAGIPGWAWFAVGAIVGAAAAYHFHSSIERVTGA